MILPFQLAQGTAVERREVGGDSRTHLQAAELAEERAQACNHPEGVLGILVPSFRDVHLAWDPLGHRLHPEEGGPEVVLYKAPHGHKPLAVDNHPVRAQTLAEEPLSASQHCRRNTDYANEGRMVELADQKYQHHQAESYRLPHLSAPGCTGYRALEGQDEQSVNSVACDRHHCRV